MDLIKLCYLNNVYSRTLYKHKLNVKLHISWPVAGNIIYYFNHSTHARTLFGLLFSLSIILFWTCLFRHSPTMIVFYTINIIYEILRSVTRTSGGTISIFILELFIPSSTKYLMHIVTTLLWNSTYGTFEHTFKISLFIFTAKRFLTINLSLKVICRYVNTVLNNAVRGYINDSI